MHVFRNGQEFNNSPDIITEFTNHPEIHEHDFITVAKIEKEILLVCSTCRSIYCTACGKFIIVNDKTRLPCCQV